MDKLSGAIERLNEIRDEFAWGLPAGAARALHDLADDLRVIAGERLTETSANAESDFLSEAFIAASEGPKASPVMVGIGSDPAQQ